MSILTQPRGSSSSVGVSRRSGAAAGASGAAAMVHAPGMVGAVRRMERSAAVTASIDPLRVLRRYAWAIIASAIIGGVLGTAAFVALREVYPLYSGMVVFMVTPGLQKSSDVGTTDFGSDDAVFRQAQTEAYLITSHDVLDAALRNPEVQRTEWGQRFMENGAFNFNDAMDKLERTISTAVKRSSNLFMLHWSASKASDVPVVLNAVASAYQNKVKDRDANTYNGNLQLFRDQLQTTQRELANVQQEIVKLISTANITTLDDTRWSAQMFQMQELMKKSAELDTNLNFALSKLQLVRQQIDGRVETSPEDRAQAEMDYSINDFMLQLNIQKSRYRDLRDARRPDDPMLISQERLVRSMETEYEDRVQKIMLRNLQSKATEMENMVKQLQSAVEENAKQMDLVGRSLKDLTGQQANLEQLNSQREYYQQKRQADMELVNEVTLMKTRSDARRVQLAQSAFTPREASFPKMQVVIPLGVLLATGLTVGLIFLRELMDKRVKSASDLAMLPGSRVLGSLPDTSDDPTRIASPEMVVRRQPGSVLAESYRQVATALFPELDQREAQTLLLVGGLPESGTTTVATNLAAAAAATGRSVLLVDANFRRPGLQKAMGVSEDALGLGDVLTGSANVDEAIHDVGDGVHVMPAGTPANRVFEKLNNGVIDGVLADLRSRYDLVIFDTPPAVVAGDALMLANKLDAAVLVVRANQEHRGLVARMINRLSESRCELVGVLLNRPRGIAGGYLKKNYATMADYSKGGSAG